MFMEYHFISQNYIHPCESLLAAMRQTLTDGIGVWLGKMVGNLLMEICQYHKVCCRSQFLFNFSLLYEA